MSAWLLFCVIGAGQAYGLSPNFSSSSQGGRQYAHESPLTDLRRTCHTLLQQLPQEKSVEQRSPQHYQACSASKGGLDAHMLQQDMWHAAERRFKAGQIILQDEHDLATIPELQAYTHILAERHAAARYVCEHELSAHSRTVLDDELAHELQGVSRQLNHRTMPHLGPSIYTDAIATVVQYGSDQHILGELQRTARALNFCYVMMQYLLTAGVGAGMGIGNTLDAIILHPVETINNMILGTLYLAWGAGYVSGVAAELIILDIFDPKFRAERVQEIDAHVSDIARVLVEQINQLDGHERVKYLSAFATEMFLMRKAPGAVGVVLAKHAHTIAQQAVKLQKVLGAARVLRKAPSSQTIRLPKISKLPVGRANITQLVHAIDDMKAQAAQVITSIKQPPLYEYIHAPRPSLIAREAPYIARMSAGGAGTLPGGLRGPPGIGQVLEPACTCRMRSGVMVCDPPALAKTHMPHPEISIPALEELTRAVIDEKRILGADGKPLRLDIKHLATLEESFHTCPQGHLRNLIHSIHFDRNLYYETTKHINIVAKCMDSSGYYAAHVKLPCGKIKFSTFFPSYWSYEQLLEEISVPLKNINFDGIVRSNYELEAALLDGTRVRIIFSKNKDVKTLYPVLAHLKEGL